MLSFGIFLVLTVAQISICSSANMTATPANATAPTDVNTFFPQIEGNLTRIIWAHAVNSKPLLNTTLSDAKVMMIEADVVLGNITGSNTSVNIPIMAHPPNKTSDLSLEEFLKEVHANGKKGVKLDFKTLDVYKASQKIIEAHYKNITVPMWLNADVLPGPVNATTEPLNFAEFIKIGKMFPNCTLSLGWTTRYGTQENVTSGNYTTDQIKKMENVITQVGNQSVTFAIRAGLAASTNISVWQELLNKTANSTLTIWSHEGDNVDVDKLRQLIVTVDIKRVYTDLPEDLMEKLHLPPGRAAQQSVHTSSIFLLSVAISFLLVKVF